MAVAALSRREVNRIVLTRPAVEAGERLGFLPGDVMAKVDPYLRPLFDALYDMLEPERVNQHLERGVIEVAPLAFMRGRTLNDSFIILDEAQNTSPEQMKMFLTRLGFNSKMVVTGDVTQIDLPRDQRSGLLVIGDILDGRRGHRVRALRRRGRGAPQARAADRRGLQRARRAAGARRCAPARASSADVELIELDASARPSAARGRRWRRLPPRVSSDGHLAIELVDAERDPGAQPRAPRHATSPPTCSPSRSTRTGRSAGPRELGDVVICPEHTEDLVEAVVHGVLHLCGYDHETDDGEMLALQDRVMELRSMTRAGFVALAGRPERRQVDAGQPDRRRRRWRSSPTGRRPRGARSAAIATGDDWQLVLVDLPGVQRPRDPLTERMQRRMERELARLRRRAVRAQRRAADRPGRPLHRRGDQAASACRPSPRSTRSTCWTARVPSRR